MPRMNDLIFRAVLMLVPMILSLSVHEYAHALVADRLGDDTPRLMGRLTLNPIPHIDLVGTFFVPLLGLYSGFFFGWAKPVQINPTRVRRSMKMGTAHMLIAVAGPASNMLMALASVLIFALVRKVAAESFPESLRALLVSFVHINIILAMFNLIPIPPLDGSTVLFWFLPWRMDGIATTLRHISPLLFIVLIIKGGFILRPMWLAMATGLDWLTFGQASLLLGQPAGLS